MKYVSVFFHFFRVFYFCILQICGYAVVYYDVFPLHGLFIEFSTRIDFAVFVQLSAVCLLQSNVFKYYLYAYCVVSLYMFKS